MYTISSTTNKYIQKLQRSTIRHRNSPQNQGYHSGAGIPRVPAHCASWQISQMESHCFWLTMMTRRHFKLLIPILKKKIGWWTACSKSKHMPR